MIDKAILALPGSKKMLVVLALCGLLQASLIVGQAWTLSHAVTELWYGAELADQFVWLGSFLVCFIAQQAVVFFQDKTLEHYASEQSSAMRKELLHKLFTVGRPLTQATGTGAVATTVLEGVDQVENYLRLMLPKLTGIVMIPLALLIAAFVLDWVSGIIMILTFPFIVLYMSILGHNAKDKAARQYSTFQRMSNHFIDSLRGLDTLKLFGVSKQRGKRIFDVSEQFRVATIKTLRVATLSGLVLDLFATLSLAAVAIMLGMRLLDGTLMLFPALMILIIVPQFYKPVRDFAGDYHASLDGKNALEAINKLNQTTLDTSEEQRLPLWQPHTKLTISGLGFAYPEHQALSGIDITVRGFTRIGIIGMSGSGKSTLIDVLGGFKLPDTGSIAIDDLSLKDLDKHDWQKQVIYLPQDPYIFHASLRDNIVFYHPDATEEELVEAVETVGLTELISELPEGLDTLIGESARALSGGQAQRIALARAFLDSSRRIMLFDEPTAHLDIETERELKERMLPLLNDRLVFFATHRLHWLYEMDTVIVLDQGSVLDCGTVADIKARHGSISELIQRIGGEQA